MVKKNILKFFVFAVVIFLIDMLLYYYNHKSVSIDEVGNVLRTLTATGFTLIAFQMFIKKKTKNS